MDTKVTSEYVTLDQLLEMTDFIQNGGETESIVKSLKVNVDGEQENRRGCKLYAGDVIDIKGNVFSPS